MDKRTKYNIDFHYYKEKKKRKLGLCHLKYDQQTDGQNNAKTRCTYYIS